MCLPRTRGFTAGGASGNYAGLVSPPHARVHPIQSKAQLQSLCVSPARGGSPWYNSEKGYGFMCLPRTRGFTVDVHVHFERHAVSSRHAGIIVIGAAAALLRLVCWSPCAAKKFNESYRQIRSRDG